MTDQQDRTIVTKMRLKKNCDADFSHWQAELQSQIVSFNGFVSLEILAPASSEDPKWTIIQRFDTYIHSHEWLNSKEHEQLRYSLKNYTLNDIEEEEFPSDNQNWGVSEIFVTQVSPDKTAEYRSWVAKIHEAESKFPGFRAVYVKSPTPGQGQNWITLLQFDSQKHLDQWLISKEREEVMLEAEPMIKSLESHRVISPFAGWFASAANEGDAPPVWRQTCLVLLVLFPVVMLELLFLSPFTNHLNMALGTFIGNAISVSLVAWPGMPVAIFFLRWWLLSSSRLITTLGFLLISLLYIIEIGIFFGKV